MPHKPDHVEVWPEHQDALNVYLACRSQWQLVVGMTGGVWRAAQAVNVAQTMQFLGIAKKDMPKVWGQYQTMEAEAMRILNTRAAAA